MLTRWYTMKRNGVPTLPSGTMKDDSTSCDGDPAVLSTEPEQAVSRVTNHFLDHLI